MFRTHDSPQRQMYVVFRVTDPTNFDLSEAASRLAAEAKKINWRFGMAGFVGPDYSFCIYYNPKPSRRLLFWYHLKHAWKALTGR